MGTPDTALASARLKIQRANEHIRNLNETTHQGVRGGKPLHNSPRVRRQGPVDAAADVKVTPTVAIKEVGLSKTYLAIPLLTQLSGYVSTILTSFEPEFF